MKVLKNIILLLFLCIFCGGGRLEAQDKFFLRDTTIEVSGLKIKFERGYGRGDIAKIKMVITNFSENYVIINPSDITIGSVKGSEKMTHYKKNIVVGPKDFTKVTVGFKELTGMGKSQTFVSVKKIGFSDALLNSFSSLSIPAELGTRLEKTNLSLDVIEVNPRAKDYAVKVDIKYTGQNFLSINYTKATFVSESGDFTNTRKSKTFYNSTLPSQKMLMIFPVTKGRDIKISGNVKLGEVFKEYSVKTLDGFKLLLNPMSEAEFRKKKEEKEEVIEEID